MNNKKMKKKIIHTLQFSQQMPSEEHWAPGTSLQVLALQHGSIHSCTYTNTTRISETYRAQASLSKLS